MDLTCQKTLNLFLKVKVGKLLKGTKIMKNNYKMFKIKVFNYKSKKLTQSEYSLAINHPNSFVFSITNGAITYFSKTHYKTKKQALKSAQLKRKIIELDL